jgi:hypothetical protein
MAPREPVERLAVAMLYPNHQVAFVVTRLIRNRSRSPTPPKPPTIVSLSVWDTAEPRACWREASVSHMKNTGAFTHPYSRPVTGDWLLAVSPNTLAECPVLTRRTDRERHRPEPVDVDNPASTSQPSPGSGWQSRRFATCMPVKMLVRQSPPLYINKGLRS